MFDLEQSIADWRKQMLPAGIKAPVPLDELESHLREEIERQIQSGASDQEAFQRTVLQIGQAKELKAEFVKNSYLFSLLRNDIFTVLHRILGALWLVLSSWGFVTLSRLMVMWYLPSAHWRGLGLLNVLIELLLLAISGAGILGSILVIRGSKPGRWIIGSIASLYALFMLSVLFGQTPVAQPSSAVIVGSFAAFYAITALIMFLPPRSNMKPARQ
jgi:hypothetical protein